MPAGQPVIKLDLRLLFAMTTLVVDLMIKEVVIAVNKSPK